MQEVREDVRWVSYLPTVCPADPSSCPLARAAPGLASVSSPDDPAAYPAALKILFVIGWILAAGGILAFFIGIFDGFTSAHGNTPPYGGGRPPTWMFIGGFVGLRAS